MAQRVLLKYRESLERLMEAAGVSMGEISRVDAVLSTIAREAGVQPNDLVLYEEYDDKDPAVPAKRIIGARLPLLGEYAPYASLVDGGNAFNAVPATQDNPWEPRDGQEGA